LVRLDPNGDFSKANCRWSKSKRGEVYEFQGERRTASAWSTKLGIPIRQVLDGLEDGKTIAEIDAEYSAALPVAA
jgi:hypothetical protein